MKKLRKLTAVLLALAMVLSLGLTVFASDDVSAPLTPAQQQGAPEGTYNTDTYKITINPASATNKNATYAAFQIFKGTLNGDGVLSDVEWGVDVDTDKTVNEKTLIAALKEIPAFAECDTAAEIADVLSKEKDNSDLVIKFAETVAPYTTGAGTPSVAEGEDGKAVITVSAPGYYLVKDTTTNVGDEASEAKSRFILGVVGDVEVTAKADAPSVEKKIVENKGEDEEDEVDTNTANIGDTVDYRIRTHVPNTTGYKSYTFNVKDTLSKGLTYDEGSLTVKVGGKLLNAKDEGEHADDWDYQLTVTSGNDGETKITVEFNPDKFLDLKYGDEILVEYSATVNDEANAKYKKGNPNEVYLEYSNDPEWNEDGTKDKSEEPKGTTPKDEVTTFTSDFDIKKVDDADNNKVLEGAEFEITGISWKEIVVKGQKFVESSHVLGDGETEADNGPYYLLKNGTYTKTTPDGENTDSYESTTQTYKLINYVEVKKELNNASFKVTATTGADGLITLHELGEGDYVIKETKAPAGYNLDDSYYHVHIEANSTGTTEDTFEVTWTAWVKKSANAVEEFPGAAAAESDDWTQLTYTSNEGGDAVASTTVTITNTQGTTLPGTGGMGTYTFYIVGGMLILAALAVLVVKMRTSKEK